MVYRERLGVITERHRTCGTEEVIFFIVMFHTTEAHLGPIKFFVEIRYNEFLNLL